jgi:hypothetical protein
LVLNQALGKTGQKPGFSIKFKVTVPKTEVLEQPPSIQTDFTLFFNKCKLDG